MDIKRQKLLHETDDIINKPWIISTTHKQIYHYTIGYDVIMRLEIDTNTWRDKINNIFFKIFNKNLRDESVEYIEILEVKLSSYRFKKSFSIKANSLEEASIEAAMREIYDM